MTLEQAKKSGSIEAVKFTMIGVIIVYLIFTGLIMYVSGASLGNALIWFTGSDFSMLIPTITAITGALISAWFFGKDAGGKIFNHSNSWTWVGIMTGIAVFIIALAGAGISIEIYELLASKTGGIKINDLPEKAYVSIVALMLALLIGLVPSALLGWFFGRSLKKKFDRG